MGLIPSDDNFDPNAAADAFLGRKTSPAPSASDVSDLLERMRGGEFAQESTGNYKPRPNPRTGAVGGFQVLPVNVGPWTQKHYGKRLTPEEFQNNPEAQESVFRGEMGSYLKKARALAPDDDRAIRMAAAAWYGGEGAMHRYDDPHRFRPNEPSFREYTTGVLNKSGAPFDPNAAADNFLNNKFDPAQVADAFLSESSNTQNTDTASLDPADTTDEDVNKLGSAIDDLMKVSAAAKAGVRYQRSMPSTPPEPIIDPELSGQGVPQSAVIAGQPTAVPLTPSVPVVRNPRLGVTPVANSQPAITKGENVPAVSPQPAPTVIPQPKHEFTDSRILDDIDENNEPTGTNTPVMDGPVTQPIDERDTDKVMRAVSDTLQLPDDIKNEDEANRYLQGQLKAKYPDGNFDKFQFLTGFHPGSKVNVTYGDLANAGIDAGNLIHQKVVENRTENPTPDLRVGRDFTADDAQTLREKFGETAGTGIASLIAVGGKTAKMLGGLVRLAEMANPATNAAKAVDPNSPEGYATDVYNYLRETGENTNKLVKNSGTKEITYDKDGRPVVSDTTGSMLEKKSIEIGGDLLRLYTMGAALPGATSILGKVGEGATLFGTQGALETAGAGGTPEQIKKETAKSAAIGGLFGVAAPIGDAVTDVAGTLLNRSIPKIFTEGVTLGTISGGTYGIDKLAGDDNATAIQDAIVNSLFHLGPHIIGKTVELVGKAGQRIVAKVGDDGHVEVAPDNAKPDYTIPLVMGTRTETLKPLNESPASTEVKGHDQGSAPADEQTAGAENTGVKPAIESTPPAGASSPEAPVEPSAEKKQPRIPVAGVKPQTPTVQGVRLDAGTENGATSPSPEATAEAMSDADVTAAAHEAATSPHNDLPEPSQAQKEAGNYQKGHININGLDISVENPVGSARSGVDKTVRSGLSRCSTTMGIIKRTVGADEEHIDVFVKPGTPRPMTGRCSSSISTILHNGKFDEHKVMLGI
jgi:hypothetical protein